MVSGIKYGLLIAVLGLSPDASSQKRPGLFGGNLLIGLEESVAVFGTSPGYAMKSRVFGRIKLEKQVGVNTLLGLNFQRQVFTVKQKPEFLVSSNTYAMVIKFFNKNRYIVPIGNYKGISLLYTSNHLSGTSKGGPGNFGDVALMLEYGKSIPVIIPRLLCNVSVSARLRVYNSEAIDPFVPFPLFYDDTKYDINEYFRLRNTLKLNFGLTYAL